MSTYNRLQSDSHFRRRKNLEELHEKYIQFAHDECYPNLIQLFIDYNEWIKQRSDLIHYYQSIQQSYEKQCRDMMEYVDMVDELRAVVYRNIHELGATSPSYPTSEYFQSPSSSPRVHSNPRQFMEDETFHRAQPVLNVEDSASNKTLMNKVRDTTVKAREQAEEGITKLDNVIRQLRSNLQRK